MTTTAYDAAGQVTGTVDRDGRAVDYAYDAAGQLHTETWKPTSTTTTIDNVITYAYAADGQLTAAADFNSAYNYAYDPTTGQLSTIDDVGSPGLPQVTLTYGYTDIGQRASVQDDQGGEVDYTYDDSFRLNSVALKVTTGTVTTDGAQVTLDYDAGGRLYTVDRQEGTGLATYTIDSTYGYDDANRLTSIDHVSNTAGTLSLMTYVYDAAGRVTGYTGPEGGRSYAYDDTDQLTSVTDTAGPTVLESFAYDATGNRTSADGVSYGAPDPGNELTSDGVYSYTYDAEGNTTVKSKSGDRWEYTYDERNQLTEAKELTGVGGTVLYDAKYTYDMFDRRIGINEDADGAGAARPCSRGPSTTGPMHTWTSTGREPS